MNKYIAIDIALLPPEEVMQKAMKINKFLGHHKIDFRRDLPHISLLMGVIEEDQMGEITDILKEIAIAKKSIDLKVIYIHEHNNEIGETVPSFEIENTPELQVLHEELIEKIQPYFQREIDDQMLCDSPGAERRHIDYIQNFIQNASFQNFDPHITLGVGKVEGTDVSFSFQASRLALCHLGDYCTCRKILGECELS